MEKIRCKILHICYSKPENGYHIFSAFREDDSKSFCVVGSYYIVSEVTVYP